MVRTPVYKEVVGSSPTRLSISVGVDPILSKGYKSLIKERVAIY